MVNRSRNGLLAEAPFSGCMGAFTDDIVVPDRGCGMIGVQNSRTSLYPYERRSAQGRERITTIDTERLRMNASQVAGKLSGVPKPLHHQICYPHQHLSISIVKTCWDNNPECYYDYMNGHHTKWATRKKAGVTDVDEIGCDDWIGCRHATGSEYPEGHGARVI